MQRVLIAGTSGSGKSTLARRVSVALSIPYVELDSLFHGPNWVPRPEFAEDVSRFIAQDEWVTEWQYPSVRPMLSARATALVWLDLSQWRTLWRVTRRTVVRRFRRTVIWNGNTEGPLWTLATDRDHVIRYSWRTRRDTARRVAQLRLDHPHLHVIRLTNQREVDAWVAGLVDD